MAADVILSVLAWVLVGLAPGAMLVLSVRPGLVRRPWELLCWAAPLSVVAVFLPAQLAASAGVPMWPWVAVVALGGPAALLAVAQGRRTSPLRRGEAGALHLGRHDGPGLDDGPPDERPTGDGTPLRPAPPAIPATGLLGVAIVLGLAVWLVGLGGLPLEPPNSDAQQHGYLAERIVDTSSVDPATTLVSSPVDGRRTVDFYPLAFHAQVALAGQLTGAPVGVLLVWWTVLGAAVLLPCAMFLLVRVLVPDRPGAAGFAAVLTPLAGAFPAQPFQFGGLTTIVGLALGLAATAVTLGAVAARTGPTGPPAPDGAGPGATARTGWACALAGACLGGAVLVHTTQAAFLAVVLGVMAGGRVLGRLRSGGLRRELGAWFLVGAGGLAALVWSVPGMVAGSAERTAAPGWIRDLTVPDALVAGVTLDADGTFAWLGGALTLAGLAVAVRRRSLGGFAAAGGVLVLLFLSLMNGDGPLSPLQGLTGPWYTTWFRVGHALVPFVVVFAAVAIDAGVSWVQDRAGTVTSGATATVLSRLGLLVVVVLTLTLVRNPVDRIQHAATTNTLVGDPEDALFRRLAGRVDRGTQVLNQLNDGTTWMYAMAGLDPFWGFAGVDGAVEPDRAYLLDRVQDVATDRRVQDLVRRWGIRYVVVGDRTYLDDPPELTRDRLRGAAGITEVDRGGHMSVFRIDPTGA